jgi:hypothetical protein
MVQAVSLIVQQSFTMRNNEKRRLWAMFLINEALTADGQHLAVICMREDGLFEGRIYKLLAGAEDDNTPGHFGDSYELCGVTETLSRIQTIIHEELGLEQMA